MRTPVLISMLAGLAMFSPGHAMATTAFTSTVEGLARKSDAVVRGRVISRESRWSSDGKLIFTFVKLRVDSVWAGQASDEVTIRVPGGLVGKYGQRVDGAPSFDPGEEVVVFLEKHGPHNHQVNGLAQGKFTVQSGQASPNTGEMMVLERPVPRGERRAEPMPLEELERRVRSVR